MKICDRCGQPLPPDFMQLQLPYFYITKSIDLLGSNQIELCHSCSKEFDKWLKTNKNNEEKIKAKVEELNEEFIAQKQFQELKTEIKELKSKRKSSLDNKKCGEKEETEPYKLYINACDPINKRFIGYKCNKCNTDINPFFDHYCPNCEKKINWKIIKNDNKQIDK